MVERIEPVKELTEPTNGTANEDTISEVAPVSSEAEAKAFIYFKESSNRLDAINSQGCKGLGQDCNGTLEPACPNWRTDYGCQDAFWERYMKSRYGTWAKAKAFWESRAPINGRDVGHWW